MSSIKEPGVFVHEPDALSEELKAEWGEITTRRQRNARRLAKFGLFVLALNWAGLGTAVWSKWPGWWVHAAWIVGGLLILKRVYHLDKGNDYEPHMPGEVMWRAFTTVCWSWFGVSFLVWLRLMVLYGGIYKAE